MTSRRRSSLVPSIVAVLALTVSGCGPFGGDDEGPAIEKAVLNLTGGIADHKLAGNELSRVADAAAALALVKPLTDVGAIAVTGIEHSDNSATAALQWNVNVDGHPWKHDTKVALVKRDGVWKVVWKPSIVESSLKAGETLSVVGIKAERFLTWKKGRTGAVQFIQNGAYSE